MPVIDVPGKTPAVNFTALTNDGKVLYFEGGQLGAAVKSITITNLRSGEQIVYIDYRPATGQLYGLSSASRLYHINESSGLASSLGQIALTPAFQGANPSLYFNPTVDRVRLVTESGQNLRLHTELGAVVATDGSINGGMSPRIEAVAYTNSFSGATTTTLFDIDFQQDKLYQQVPPNDGGLVEVGNLGIDFAGVGDMDILVDNSMAMAVVRSENEIRLYTIDLISATAAWVGVFSQPVVRIAFKTNPIAYAASDNNLYRFDPTNPKPMVTAFTGLAVGEKITELDFRPVNGQLIAVSNQGQLYAFNPSSAALTKIGIPLTPLANGIFVGFDFNPIVDRIREWI